LGDGIDFSSRIAFLLSRMSLFIRRGAGAAVCEVDPLDIVETTVKEWLMPHPDLTVGIAHCSPGNTFAVTPEDSSREHEGPQ
jgi:hypothetical protein